jgi:hypothetical protein
MIEGFRKKIARNLFQFPKYASGQTIIRRTLYKY